MGDSNEPEGDPGPFLSPSGPLKKVKVQTKTPMYWQTVGKYFNSFNRKKEGGARTHDAYGREIWGGLKGIDPDSMLRQPYVGYESRMRQIRRWGTRVKKLEENGGKRSNKRTRDDAKSAYDIHNSGSAMSPLDSSSSSSNNNSNSEDAANGSGGKMMSPSDGDTHLLVNAIVAAEGDNADSSSLWRAVGDNEEEDSSSSSLAGANKRHRH